MQEDSFVSKIKSLMLVNGNHTIHSRLRPYLQFEEGSRYTNDYYSFVLCQLLFTGN